MSDETSEETIIIYSSLALVGVIILTVLIYYFWKWCKKRRSLTNSNQDVETGKSCAKQANNNEIDTSAHLASIQSDITIHSDTEIVFQPSLSLSTSPAVVTLVKHNSNDDKNANLAMIKTTATNYSDADKVIITPTLHSLPTSPVKANLLKQNNLSFNPVTISNNTLSNRSVLPSNSSVITAPQQHKQILTPVSKNANKNINQFPTLTTSAIKGETNNSNQNLHKRNRKRNQNKKGRKRPQRTNRFNNERRQKAIVIAVDATPTTIGGYCINKFNNEIQYYSVPSMQMPWNLRNKTRGGNPTEFEMKNLLCGLLLWQHLILRYRKLEIYTDNSAIIGRSEYGQRVRNYLSHLENCEGVRLLNPNGDIYLNSNYNYEQFDDLITPADLLSRNCIDEFIASVDCNAGDVNNFQEIGFRRVRQQIHYWTRNSCSHCGFCIQYTGSFKKVNKYQ